MLKTVFLLPYNSNLMFSSRIEFVHSVNNICKYISINVFSSVLAMLVMLCYMLFVGYVGYVMLYVIYKTLTFALALEHSFSHSSHHPSSQSNKNDTESNHFRH